MLDLSTIAFGHPEHAAPGAADPIFAAIERLRAAEGEWLAARSRCDEAMKEGDATARAEAEAMEKRSAAALSVATESFVATVPRTLAGARAGLALALELDDGKWLRLFVESMLRSPVAAPDPLLAAIERHKALFAEVEALPRDEDVSDRLAEAEGAALRELATLPCRDDAIFHAKLRHMVANHKLEYGRAWRETEARQIMIALELHLFGDIGA
jgi:hypothetical protein